VLQTFELVYSEISQKQHGEYIIHLNESNKTRDAMEYKEHFKLFKIRNAMECKRAFD
jgi:hypothetical protein